MLSRRQKETAPTGTAKEAMLDRALGGFMSKLPDKGFPNESQLRDGQNTAEQVFQDMLCRESSLRELAGFEGDLTNKAGLVKLELADWMSNFPLQLPAPVFNERLNGIKLALAVVLGTFLGGIFLSGLFNFVSDDPRTGFTIGTMLGAGGSVLLMWYASESRKLRRYLQGLLGVATAAEIAILFGKLSGVGAIWSALRISIPGMGLLRVMRRFFLYIGVVFVLRFSVRRPEFDRLTYQKNVKVTFSQWLDHALTFIQTLADKAPQAEAEIPEKIMVPKALGMCLHKIHQSSPDVLPEAAAEILQVARNIGVEGLDGEAVFLNGQAEQPAQFVWEATFENQYQPYGVVEAGDTVFVESRPLIQDGKVIEKGSVRKVRKR